MTKARKTCDKCRHYTKSDDAGSERYKNAGACALIGDSNDRSYEEPVVDIDRAIGWDYEGYRAGAYVGPKFGCIHFESKQAKAE